MPNTEERKLPKCSYCAKRIKEYFFVFDGKSLCEQCVVDYHRVRVADYMR